MTNETAKAIDVIKRALPRVCTSYMTQEREAAIAEVLNAAEAQQREIERYKTISGYEDVCRQSFQQEIAALRERVEMLESALKPFAERARYVDKHCPEAPDTDETSVWIRELRKAARALTPAAPTGEIE